ncbi:MAG: hypothetical protein IPI50_10135 [Saprospiraceae bacterium]|nr:hypothetical protein [Saprospiraceae bacterium]
MNNPHFNQFLTILFVSLSISLGGQSQINKKLNYGVGIGLSWNNVFNHLAGAKFDPRISPILITTNVQYIFDRRWTVLSELDYIHKGPLNHDINYLVLSVLPKFKVFSNPNISLLAGPYMGYLFRYKARGIISTSDRIKKYDVGMDAGIHYSKRINENFNIFISPRVELGLIIFSQSQHISYQLRAGVEF